MMNDLKVKLSRRADGMFQADTNDDRHAVGDTRGEALCSLGLFIDRTDARERWNLPDGLTGLGPEYVNAHGVPSSNAPQRYVDGATSLKNAFSWSHTPFSLHYWATKSHMRFAELTPEDQGYILYIAKVWQEKGNLPDGPRECGSSEC